MGLRNNLALLQPPAGFTPYTWYLNFNTTAQSISGWLDITASNLTSAVYSASIGNGANLSSVATANWGAYFGGTCSNTGFSGSTPSGIPSTVGASQWYTASSATFYLKTKAAALLQISGLISSGLYTITIYSAVDSGGYGRTATNDLVYYSVNGGTDQSVSAVANSTTILTFSSLTPDGSGVLWVNAGNNASDALPLFNAMTISRTA